MLDMEALLRLVEEQHYAPLFVTVSGAHLYGFPSPDSDYDVRFLWCASEARITCGGGFHPASCRLSW